MPQIHSSSQARHAVADASQNEALDWFLKLQADPDNSALKQAFVVWKDSEPDNESRYLEVLLLWDKMGKVDEAAVTPQHGTGHLLKPVGKTPLSKGYCWLGASLCCVLLMLMVFVPASVLVPLSDADFVTDSAQHSIFRLEDGSRLYMSGGTAVAVEMSPTSRTVHLLRGEAFFEVVKDPLRPFRVMAGDTVTVAVGTAFNIRLGDRQVTVSLTEGVVDTAAGGEPVRLNAGQELRYRHGKFDVQAGSARYWPAWKRGTASVEDMPVSELVTLLNRHYAAVIRSVDPRLTDARVSGILPLDDLPTALKMLQQTLGIRHITLSDSLVLLHR